MIADWALYARAVMTRSSCYEANLELERERERRHDVDIASSLLTLLP